MVVVGNTFGVLSSLSAESESLLSSKLDLESSSHDSGCSSESSDSGGSLSLSSVLGLELTMSSKLSVSSGADRSLLSTVSVSSSLNGGEVSEVGKSVSLDSFSADNKSALLSSLSAELGLLPGHHGGVLSSHSADSS